MRPHRHLRRQHAPSLQPPAADTDVPAPTSALPSIVEATTTLLSSPPSDTTLLNSSPANASQQTVDPAQFNILASLPSHNKFDHPKLIYQINLFIIAIVVVFVVCALPRLIFRFSHKDEWRNGHFLRSGEKLGEDEGIEQDQISRPISVTLPKGGENDSEEDLNEKKTSTEDDPKKTRRTTLLPPGLHPPSSLNQPASYFASPDQSGITTGTTKEEEEKDQDRTFHLFKNADLGRSASNASTATFASTISTSSTLTNGSSIRRRRRRENLPKHIPSLSTIIPYATSVLRYTIRPGIDVGKMSVLVGYFLVLFFGAVHRSNVFSDAIRTGYLSVSQIPVVVILGTKNNFLGMLLGAGYERLNVYHRYAGLMLVLACNVHTLGYFYQWALAGTLAKELAQPLHARITVSLVCMDVLAFFSTSFWRNKYYNVFLVSHVLAVITLFATVCNHSPAAAPYVWFSIIVFILDRISRGLKTRYTTAHLTPIPDMSMTRIELPNLTKGWRAGQHVRIQILSREMGRMGWLEVHPFTIASISESDDGSGLVLMCKKTGSWTRKLFDLAKRPSSEIPTSLSNRSPRPLSLAASLVRVGRPRSQMVEAVPTLWPQHTREVKVLVEGPYGGPGHTMFCSYSGAMFVCGGSGITFALSAIQDLVKKDIQGESRVKTIDLVWTVPDPNTVKPVLPLFGHLLATRTYLTLTIHIHYTRAGFPMTILTSPTSPLHPSQLPPGLAISPGRPRLASVLEEVIERACTLTFEMKGNGMSGAGWSKGFGVVVGVCGPTGLGDEVRGVVRSVEREKMRKVGGVEIHEEVFGW